MVADNETTFDKVPMDTDKKHWPPSRFSLINASTFVSAYFSRELHRCAEPRLP
jgi:hypothetical protein